MKKLSKKDEFIEKYLNPDLYEVIGEFENEFGELFLVYKLKDLEHAYVTGDEVDWEFGYLWLPKHGALGQLFGLSISEIEKLKELLKENK